MTGSRRQSTMDLGQGCFGGSGSFPCYVIARVGVGGFRATPPPAPEYATGLGWGLGPLDTSWGPTESLGLLGPQKLIISNCKIEVTSMLRGNFISLLSVSLLCCLIRIHYLWYIIT